MSKRVFPVIHAKNSEQVTWNTKIAKMAGADGVFVINHGISVDELLELAVEARKIISWVGINCLGYGPLTAMETVPNFVSGLWTDNAKIDETADEQPHAKAVWQLKQVRSWEGEYFGGVAFKYQKPVTDLVRATVESVPYMDVITTSGRGTGKAADPQKIKTMREALDSWMLSCKIGVASGITPDNIADYLPYADDFLVATGISYDFHNLDPEKTRILIEKAKS